MAEQLDLDAIEREHLTQCGAHDYGLSEYGCNCSTADPRPVISRLVDEVRRLRKALGRANAYHPNGRCRICGRREGKHGMSCRQYVGPLRHAWESVRPNETFGGMDYRCTCGGWFRQGGLAGHGDGTEVAGPVCPNSGDDWRGAKGDDHGE